MQYTHTKVLDKVNLRNWAIRIAKSAFFIGAIYWVMHSLSQKQVLTTSFGGHALAALGSPIVWFVIFLLFINWGIEALKWKMLAQRLMPITFIESVSGVFTGVCFGMITPHGIGDYAGRILQLQTKDRLEAIGAVFVSRIAQLLITVLFGSVALVGMIDNGTISSSSLVNLTLLQVIFILNICFLGAVIFYKKVIRIFKNKYTKPYLKIIATISTSDMWQVMGLSIVRYTIFAGQYILLLYYVGIPCSVIILAQGVAFVFIVKSIIPTFFDIGIREAAALYFFSSYTADAESIVFASLLLWIINIVLPAIAGAVLIFKIRWFSVS